MWRQHLPKLVYASRFVLERFISSVINDIGVCKSTKLKVISCFTLTELSRNTNDTITSHTVDLSKLVRHDHLTFLFLYMSHIYLLSFMPCCVFSQQGSLVCTLSGHSSWVVSVTFNRDNQHFATCSADKTVRIWDLNAKTNKSTLHDHNDQVRLNATLTRDILNIWQLSLAAPMKISFPSRMFKMTLKGKQIILSEQIYKEIYLTLKNIMLVSISILKK